MIGRFKNLGKDELVRGSFILLAVISIFNILNYIFQMSMARLLGPADYGILAVLMSIVYIFGIPSEAIQTVIARYTSKFGIKKENGKIKDLMYRSLKKLFLFSVIAFIVFTILSISLSKMLKIDFWLLALTGLFIFYLFSVPVIRGILQGKKRFLGLGLNMVVESFGKVVFSILLVLLGWKVYGAITGLVIGGVAAFILAFMSVKDIIFTKIKRNQDLSGAYRYNLPVLIGITSIVLIYSLDVILARIFFNPELAGKYALVSLIGKVILFSSFAISKAMFPIASENFERGRKTSSILKKSIVLILLISAVMLFLCFFIPENVIRVISLGSSQYVSASDILFFVSLAFSFTALTNVIINYSLSINRIRRSSLTLLVFVIMEVVLLSIFNSNLREFAISLLVVNFLMFIYSLWLIKNEIFNNNSCT
ncbi:MAG: oligosaccharide flippase family protein [Nanoarchaeota archaeon]|nr:oligosaccharide flippase family protein [Nanoarchaeota archaeon]MBU4086036.1 oligosaccharide flippase family protein [Nanoarchaeota archaeon]